ncbi:MAG: DUF1036 domain-containing protein [Pseudomonadota bacterium]
MRKLFPALASIVAGILVFSSQAEAKYSLCNKTSYTLSAAIAYVESDRLATRGWWRLYPGQCKVVLNDQTAPGRYFAYAEGIQGHRGNLKSWSGDTKLCVENSGFFNLRNQEVCKDDPTRQRSFFDVEVTPEAGGNWQTDFVEQSNFEVYKAKIAGVQRLLADVGASTGRIDGVLGRQTQADLISYRKSRSLGEDATIDNATFEKLVEEANAGEAKRGLFYCNRTDKEIWTALATNEGETLRSSGWWRIDAGACSKIVKGELANEDYYVFGVIEEPRGELRLSGGDKPLCVNSIKFEVANTTPCAELDLETAVFKKFEISDKNLATFEFETSMFVAPPAQTPPSE